MRQYLRVYRNGRKYFYMGNTAGAMYDGLVRLYGKGGMTATGVRVYVSKGNGRWVRLPLKVK